MLYKISNRKKYKITNKLIAKLFKYSSPQAFDNSSAKDRILQGIDKLIEHIEQTIAHDTN